MIRNGFACFLGSAWAVASVHAVDQAKTTNVAAVRQEPAKPAAVMKATPAEVDAFLFRWSAEVQTNRIFALAPMLKVETNGVALAAKLMGALERDPWDLWVSMLEMVAGPAAHGREGTLPPEQTVSVWKQICASLEKWIKAPDADLTALEIRFAKDSVPETRTISAADLEKWLQAIDPHNEQARVYLRRSLDMARQNLAAACLVAGGGHLAEAGTLARQLLDGNTVTNWNYGNIIYKAHSLLGRVALRQGDRATARTELRAAGQTPGSPQLNSYGPQFDLARELLQDGNAEDRESVVAFLDDVAKFWANPDKGPAHYQDTATKSRQEIESWKTAIRAGNIPTSPKWR